MRVRKSEGQKCQSQSRASVAPSVALAAAGCAVSVCMALISIHERALSNFRVDVRFAHCHRARGTESRFSDAGTRPIVDIDFGAFFSIFGPKAVPKKNWGPVALPPPSVFPCVLPDAARLRLCVLPDDARLGNKGILRQNCNSY